MKTLQLKFYHSVGKIWRGWEKTSQSTVSLITTAPVSQSLAEGRSLPYTAANESALKLCSLQTLNQKNIEKAFLLQPKDLSISDRPTSQSRSSKILTISGQCRKSPSFSSSNVIANPCRPARPVLPMRWTYSQTLFLSLLKVGKVFL